MHTSSTDVTQSNKKESSDNFLESQVEFSMLDWMSDNPGTMFLYMIGCLGVGSLIGGVYLGNRAIKNYSTKDFKVIGTMLPDIRKGFKRMARPPTRGELRAAVDESIDYHQNPEKQGNVSFDHVFEISKPQSADNTSNDTARVISPVYGNARRKNLTANEMTNVQAEMIKSPKIGFIPENKPSSEEEEDLQVDFSTAPTTKEELEEMKKKIEKMKARKLGRRLAVRAFVGGTIVSVVSFTVVGGLLCWFFDVWTFKDFVIKLKAQFQGFLSSSSRLADFFVKTKDTVSKPVSESYLSRMMNRNRDKQQPQTEKNDVNSQPSVVDSELEQAIEELFEDIMLRPVPVPFISKPKGEEALRIAAEMIETDIRIKERASALMPGIFDDENDEDTKPKKNIISRGFSNITSKLFGDETSAQQNTVDVTDNQPIVSDLGSLSSGHTYIECNGDSPLLANTMNNVSWTEWSYSWVSPSAWSAWYTGSKA